MEEQIELPPTEIKEDPKLQSGLVHFDVEFEYLPLQNRIVSPNNWAEDYYLLDAWLSVVDFYYDFPSVIAAHGAYTDSESITHLTGDIPKQHSLQSFQETLGYLKRSVPAFVDMNYIIWLSNSKKEKLKFEQILANAVTDYQKAICKQHLESFPGIYATITIKLQIFPEKQ